jgi:hypothetical protein
MFELAELDATVESHVVDHDTRGSLLAGIVLAFLLHHQLVVHAKFAWQAEAAQSKNTLSVRQFSFSLFLHPIGYERPAPPLRAECC